MDLSLPLFLEIGAEIRDNQFKLGDETVMERAKDTKYGIIRVIVSREIVTNESFCCLFVVQTSDDNPVGKPGSRTGRASCTLPAHSAHLL